MYVTGQIKASRTKMHFKSSCFGLRSVRLPASLRSVGENAFMGCAALTDVEFSGDGTYLAPGCFSMCPIREFRFPRRTAEIQTSVLRGCAYLENVDIPEGVDSIWERAFEGCMSLKTLHLPESLELIGEGAFSNALSLESIVIPSKVRSIADEAFAFTPNLTDLSVSPDNARFEVRDGALIDREEKRLICCLSCREGSYSVPADIETVGALAFSASRLSELTLPANVKRAGDWAFRASQIRKLTVENENISFGAGALLDTDAENIEINAPEAVRKQLLGDEETA